MTQKGAFQERANLSMPSRRGVRVDVQLSTSSRGKNASPASAVPLLECAPFSRTISSIYHSALCMDALSPSLQSPGHVAFFVNIPRKAFIDIVENVREVYKTVLAPARPYKHSKSSLFSYSYFTSPPLSLILVPTTLCIKQRYHIYSSSYVPRLLKTIMDLSFPSGSRC